MIEETQNNKETNISIVPKVPKVSTFFKLDLRLFKESTTTTSFGTFRKVHFWFAVRQENFLLSC